VAAIPSALVGWAGNDNNEITNPVSQNNFNGSVRNWVCLLVCVEVARNMS